MEKILRLKTAESGLFLETNCNLITIKVNFIDDDKVS